MICGRPPGRPFGFLCPPACPPAGGRRAGRRAQLWSAATLRRGRTRFFSCCCKIAPGAKTADKIFFLHLAFVCLCEQEIVLTPARRFSKPNFAARRGILRRVCWLATEKLPELFSSSLISCYSKKKTLSAVFSESVSDCLQEKKLVLPQIFLTPSQKSLVNIALIW